MANKVLAAGITLILAACGNVEPQVVEGEPAKSSQVQKPKLGLMTSLPLYWPLDADFSDLATGDAKAPWQRAALADHELVLLDTLTPIAGLTPEDPESDPLEGIERLAIIQPRGLSPADNAALDEWVRAGGQLLIAVDPMLTGDYDLALGDPRRPVDSGLVPPVIARWGIAGTYSPELTEVRYAELPMGRVPVLMAQELRVVEDGGQSGCRAHESDLLVRCDNVAAGTVTYIGDAAVFEHQELAGEDAAGIQALIAFAFAER